MCIVDNCSHFLFIYFAIEGLTRQAKGVKHRQAENHGVSQGQKDVIPNREYLPVKAENLWTDLLKVSLSVIFLSSVDGSMVADKISAMNWLFVEFSAKMLLAFDC